ncbi:acyl-CoA thioesterase [Thermus scotoductus]|uniref:Acyl-CoA thioesterase n=1 Tax=Thermus scotoductus TaxID=37636 RepID=A0A430QVE9_THESC|nr:MULTISPECIES: thioesterase family protein [Thermus]ETN88683.1 esterase [Thermus sp. NMX2.A1]RTG92092.1 acyl-CoA thioesterase [Thermus scotoductus]RTG93135.1 acyl-CoA thioesterase [Thermus scotoductus]RTG94314.1 acyl-CoA thioesterase [Thermus scotoductus]RTG98947.1 acyl-CoA thioesterase [Thermus scotoductus]
MESETRIKVRYAETDQMGVVHHSVYAVYLEAARVEFLEKAGLPYHRVEARGVFFPVVELGLTFRAPARFGEEVLVRTRLAHLSRRDLLFRYRVEREGTLLAEGFTRHLCQVGEKAGRIPEDIYQALSVLHLG